MKITDVFDRLDNVLANYSDGIADSEDVIRVAMAVNQYLIENPHPHDILIEDVLNSTNQHGQSKKEN